MELAEFYQLHNGRIRAYSRLFAARWGLPAHVSEDLYQACWLGILEALPSWRPASGSEPHRSAFNWCAKKMRAEMEKVVRVLHGLKPCGYAEIRNRTQSEDFSSFATREFDIESAIDLKRVLESDPKPVQVARFVLTAINPNEKADVAKLARVTRQGVCKAVGVTRARLRLALG